MTQDQWKYHDSTVYAGLHIIDDMHMSVDLAKRLKPNELRLLVKIAETGQLQTAAQMNAMSQPAASRMLAHMETVAGDRLFLRHAKGMEPSPLGKIFVRHAKVVLNALDELAEETTRHAKGEIGHVRIGAVTGPAVGALTPAIQRIKSKSPEIEFSVDVGPSTDLVRGLLENRFDFVIARLPPDYDSRDFNMYPARNEMVSLLVNPDNPLAHQSSIPMVDTLDFDWVVQQVGTPIRQAVEAAFWANGLTPPRRVTNTSSLLVSLSLLRNPDTIAPVSEDVAVMLCEGPLAARAKVLDMATPISVSPCYVIENRHKPQSQLASQVMAALFEEL